MELEHRMRVQGSGPSAPKPTPPELPIQAIQTPLPAQIPGFQPLPGEPQAPPPETEPVMTPTSGAEDQAKFGKSPSYAKSGTPTAPLPEVTRPALPVKAMPRPASPGTAGSPAASSGAPDVAKASQTLQQMRMAVHIREMQEREVAQGTRSGTVPQVSFNLGVQERQAAGGRDVTQGIPDRMECCTSFPPGLKRE